MNRIMLINYLNINLVISIFFIFYFITFPVNNVDMLAKLSPNCLSKVSIILGS